jgi:predicted nuclease of predicted toxin-antitoxin system
VKFLVDNQLPVALAKWLISRGHDARHVADLALDAATDTEIWNYAAVNSFVLITKDEDFSHRASQLNASVQVVWVRRGKCRKAALLSAFDWVLEQIEAALRAGDRLIEVRY